MENNKDKNVCRGCMCGGSCAGGNCDCGGGMYGWHGGGHHVLRMILKLILVALIFTIGFKLGVMTGYIRAGYGYGMGGAGNNWGMMRGFNGVNPGNMMQNGQGALPVPAP